MAYGHVLEYESRWSLAADVYRTLVAYAHPIDDADLVVSAHIQLAFCLRMSATSMRRLRRMQMRLASRVWLAT